MYCIFKPIIAIEQMAEASNAFKLTIALVMIIAGSFDTLGPSILIQFTRPKTNKS